MLHFKFFYQLECRLFVISHVLVPGLLELGELGLLSSLDVHQLFLLRESHVLLLALLLGATELVKFLLHQFGACVVLLAFVANTKSIEDFEEPDDLIIRQEVDARLWQQGPILALV